MSKSSVALVSGRVRKSSKRSASTNLFGGAAIACLVLGAGWTIYNNIIAASVYPTLGTAGYDDPVSPRAKVASRSISQTLDDAFAGLDAVEEEAPPPAKPGASAAPSAADANTGYLLQVGAYKTSADAEQQRARLAFQGFESKVTQRDAGGITYYRVRIGPFARFEDMNSTRQRLSDAGIDTAVIRFTKQ